jgi:hypothetical protein
MARTLDLTQAQVIASIEILISEGRLDAATLRPPSFPAGVSTPPAGCGADVQQAKAAAAPPSQPSTPAPRHPPRVTGPVLAAEVDAFLAAHPNLAQRRVLAAMGMGASCLAAFRRGDRLPTPARAIKVRGVMSGPVRDDWVKKPKGQRPGTVRGPRVQRSPTDVGVARQSAALRRSQTAQAERILDKNPEALSGRNSGITQAIAAVRRSREEAARRTDPIEHAKLALRKRGRVVFDASVDGGRKGRFFVSGQTDPVTGKRKQLTADELTALAWKVNPLAMQEITGSEAHAS